jgi:large subunit ribosomal protein L2
VGSVSNPLNRNRVWGKAGWKRLRGIRPTVRGIAMNPVDHPHGGRTNGGRPSCSPWGVLAKGYRTRDKRKPSAKFIMTSRHEAKRGR